jgi:hypothetical protein
MYSEHKRPRLDASTPQPAARSGIAMPITGTGGLLSFSHS